MLNQISSADVAAVGSAMQDRLSRCVKDTAELMEICQRHGVHLVVPQNGIDTFRTGWNAQVVAQVNSQAVFAQYYSDDVSDKTKMKVRYYRELGILWSKPPFGAKREGTKREAMFVPSRDHAAMVQCLENYVNARSYAAAADRLNDLGIRHRGRKGQEKPFTTEAVRTIVGSVMFYLGYLLPGRSAKTERVKLEGEGSYVERYARAVGAKRSPHISPMIDVSLAERVIERRFSTQTAGRKPTLWTPLLTPIAYFGEQQLRADGRPIGGNWYRTRKAGLWVDADKMDAEFLEHLAGIQFPPELVDAIRTEMLRRTNDTVRQKLERDAEDLRAKMGTLQEMRLDGAIERDAFNDKHMAYIARLRGIEAQLNAPSEVDMQMRALADLGGTIKMMTKERQRRAVHALFERVEFDEQGKIVRVYPRPAMEVLFDGLKSVCANDALNGIRTRVLALKGPRPSPLDDEGLANGWRLYHARL